MSNLDVEDAHIGAFDEDGQAFFESLAAALTDLYIQPEREGSANAAP